MPRARKELTALQVKALRKQEGLHAVSRNLYLRVREGGEGAAWVYRYWDGGARKNRDMGLGSFPPVTLAQARQDVAEYNLLRREGLDPITVRKQRQAENKGADVPNFDRCAELFFADKEAEWTNAKHRAQWRSTLDTYASPVFGKKPVSQIGLDDVLAALQPIWGTKTETASRLRGRIENVLDWAGVKGYRQGENPARWRGHLDKLLPKRSKTAPQKHHPALPYGQLPDFLAALLQESGNAAQCLEFTVLTACRTGEVVGARWEEFDLAAKVWTVPPDRMKAKREHRVPLTDQALAVLESMQKVKQSEFVFPGQRVKRPLSNMAMLQVLNRIGYGAYTVHGFRSTFRDWAAEQTSFPHEVAEMALAHVIGNKAEAAYRRGDMFEKRRKLMAAWANYATAAAKGGKVTPITRGRKHVG
jgi:integrase